MEEDNELSILCENLDFGDHYAPGWNSKRLVQRIDDIRRYYRSNLAYRREECSESGIVSESGCVSLAERREIARKTQELLKIFERVGGIDLDPLFSQTLGLDWLFLQTLKGLAKHSEDRQTLEGHVAAMIVRLYIEAHEKPGFTARGPLVRFARKVYDFLKVSKTEQLSEAALKAEFNKLKLDVFISCRLEFVEGESITAAELLKAWENDCAKNGAKPTTPERFSQRIEKNEKFQKHVKCARIGGRRVYRGVKLKAKLNELDPARKKLDLKIIYKTMG
jgi:hypothetical protein